jgi:hypothetical protein
MVFPSQAAIGFAVQYTNMTGSVSRKPRLAREDKGRNKKASSLPGSTALWAGSISVVELLDQSSQRIAI